VLQQDCIEVEQKAVPQPTQPQVRQHLRLMKSCELVKALDLQNQLFLYNDVQAVATNEPMAFEDDR
jgi:hypothetical protein